MYVDSQPPLILILTWAYAESCNAQFYEIYYTVNEQKRSLDPRNNVPHKWNGKFCSNAFIGAAYIFSK